VPIISLRRLFKGVFRRAYRIGRNIQFNLLSTNDQVTGSPNNSQPVLYLGKGSIYFEKNVKIGISSSPGYWSTYCYLESRSETASISIGENTWINNGFSAISEKKSIKIGCNCLIGIDVSIYDSDFHDLNPLKRHGGGNVRAGDVEIFDNVFIGSRVTILKNTKIGQGCAIAAGSVVSGVFPSNCLIGGNPASYIKKL
tara:strand:+ start:1141 stop:1734 length:594 start_codon:yes stop_codon:yes gene_type:complete